MKMNYKYKRYGTTLAALTTSSISADWLVRQGCFSRAETSVEKPSLPRSSQKCSTRLLHCAHGCFCVKVAEDAHTTEFVSVVSGMAPKALWFNGEATIVTTVVVTAVNTNIYTMVVYDLVLVFCNYTPNKRDYATTFRAFTNSVARVRTVSSERGVSR